MSLKVKNWAKFQHFKNRRPPWIKLYRDILEQRDINVISDRCFRVLVCLWLLASESREQDGTLPPVEDIAFRLRLSKDDVLQAISQLSDFLDGDDIKAISKRYQDDPPETEIETEREREGEDRAGKKSEGAARSKAPIKVADRLDQLRKIYQPIGVDVDRELVKCRAWCESRNLSEPSYRRLVNWLNKCDTTVKGCEHPSVHRGMQEVIKPKILFAPKLQQENTK